MKTTLELPDALFRELKECVAAEGVTMRSLVEEALRRELERRSTQEKWRPTGDFSYGEGGLAPEVEHLSWAEIRDLAGREVDIIAKISRSEVQ